MCYVVVNGLMDPHESAYSEFARSTNGSRPKVKVLGLDDCPRPIIVLSLSYRPVPVGETTAFGALGIDG